MIVKNEVSDERAEEMMDALDADSLEAIAKSMEEDVEQLLAAQFGDADEIPLLSVDSFVEEQ